MNYLRKLPPLTSLRVFDAVARHQSVTNAAFELCVTPAAVSQQIKILEQYFGRPLFLRRSRGLTPTEEARAYLVHVSRALDGLVGASEQMRQEHHAGTVTISILPSLATCWLAPRIGRFKRRFPNIRLSIVSDMELVDFQRSDVDMALRYGSGQYHGLQVDRLMTETLFPVCSPRLIGDSGGLHRPADLAQHCLLHEMLSPVHPSVEPWIHWRPWLESWGMTAADCPDRIDMTDTAALLGAAGEGSGVAIGRSRLMAPLIESGRLVPLFDQRRLSRLAYYIVTPPGAAELPRVKAVREWLLDEAAGEDALRPQEA
jgi:LysR family glycine cleavage system transcriptional activator